MSNNTLADRYIAVISGTGFEEAFAEHARVQTIDTPYGIVSPSIIEGERGGFVVLPRHGRTHSIPPHKINVHANMWALKELGVQYILATSAVGSLRSQLTPGTMVILSDFIDFRGTVTTYSDSTVRHVDFSSPFSSSARKALIQAAHLINRKESSPPAVYESGTYLCVSGPRYETPAEVRLFAQWGADVVGMTVAPEAILARELGLDYAAVSVITNLGTGLSESALDHNEVNSQMEKNRAFLIALIEKTSRLLLGEII